MFLFIILEYFLEVSLKYSVEEVPLTDKFTRAGLFEAIHTICLEELLEKLNN